MRVVVVGGGLAALFTASELLAARIDDVLVVDAASAPGGVARTIDRDGFSLETAAGSFSLPHPHLSPILERVGVRVEPARQAGLRHLYIDGRLVSLSASPRALLAPVIPLRAKLRALAEPLVRSGPGSEESLDAFCRRRFGARAGELMAWLMASGVFAGDPRRLSVAASFPMLASLEGEYGSVIRGAIRGRRTRPRPRPRTHVPTGGMTALAEAFAGSLGDRFRADFPVESVRREGKRWIINGPEALVADAVVLAVRPEVAADLIDGELGEHLRRVRSAPVAVVGLGGPGPSPAPPGFGVLVGPGEGLVTLGALFESSYATHRAPDDSWLVKVIAGGATNPGSVDWDDDRLVSQVTGEVSRMLGADLTPDFVEVVRHRPGIPQYETGHSNWLTRLDELTEKEPGLYLTGWGYRGVGVANLATDAVKLAGEISSDASLVL